MARNGPRDDFHEQATQHADYRAVEQPPPGEFPPSAPDEFEQAEAFEGPEAEPTPWYRKPALLIAWLVFVAILIALIVYGIIQLLHGEQGTTPTPSTGTTTTTTSTTPPTTTTTTTPSTTAGGAPPQQPTQRQPTQQQPTRQPAQQPTQQEPTHRHHLPQVPSVITIPGVPTVITVPPGLR